jgi:hypothetical protein
LGANEGAPSEAAARLDEFVFGAVAGLGKIARRSASERRAVENAEGVLSVLGFHRLPRLIAKTNKAYANYRKTFDMVGDARTFDLLLETAAEFSFHFVTLEVLKMMREDIVPLSAAQAMNVMNVGLSRRYGPLVRLGYERILELGVSKIINEGTWMELVQHWAVRGNFSNILAIEPLLKQRYPDSQPCEAFYHLAIHAMTKKPHASNESRHVPWSELFGMLHRMEDAGFSTESRMLGRRIMGPFLTVENVDGAYFALEDMRDDPACTSKPRLSDLNLVIRGCGRLQDLDRAFATFAEIPKFGLIADSSTFAELLNVCGACGDGQAALHVEKQMNALGLELNSATVRALASATLSREYWRRAFELSQTHMALMPPELVHSVVYFTIRAKRFSEAKEVVNKATATFPKFVLAEALAKEIDTALQRREEKQKENPSKKMKD